MAVIIKTAAETLSYVEMFKRNGIRINEYKEAYSREVRISEGVGYIIMISYAYPSLFRELPIVLISEVKNYKNLFVFPVTSIFRDFEDCYKWLQTMTTRDFMDLIKNHVSKFLKVF